MTIPSGAFLTTKRWDMTVRGWIHPLLMRLDRVGTQAWQQLYPNVVIQNLEYGHSDHRPLLLDTEFHQSGPANMGRNRFEARWLLEAQFAKKVQHAWEEASVRAEGTGVMAKLRYMHSSFHDWDQRVLKKPKKRPRKAQRDLENVMRGNLDDSTEVRRKELAELIEFLLELEEVQQMQRPRVTWLKCGDTNTSFFQEFCCG